MKNILIRDYKILKPYLKYFLLILVIMALNIFRYADKNESNLIYIFFASDIKMNKNFIELGYNIIINFSMIWISVKLLSYDIRNNSGFIFLRISKRNWLIKKYISISVYLIVINLIILIEYITITGLVYSNINMISVLIPFIKIILSKFFIINTSILLLLIIDKYGILLMSFIFLIPMYTYNRFSNILQYFYAFENSNVLTNIIIYILFFIVSFIINKKLLINFFERNV